MIQAGFLFYTIKVFGSFNLTYPRAYTVDSVSECALCYNYMSLLIGVAGAVLADAPKGLVVSRALPESRRERRGAAMRSALHRLRDSHGRRLPQAGPRPPRKSVLRPRRLGRSHQGKPGRLSFGLV